MSNKLDHQAGFTLIEAMVALVILTTAMAPLLHLANSATNSAFVIRDNMIAAGLVQEQIEVIRAIRDSNWFNGRSFDVGLTAGTYRTEWNTQTLIPAGTNPPLLVANGIYNYNTGTPTLFTRTVTITKLNAGELRVVSTVSIPARGGATRTIQAEDHLFNWK